MPVTTDTERRWREAEALLADARTVLEDSVANFLNGELRLSTLQAAYDTLGRVRGIARSLEQDVRRARVTLPFVPFRNGL